MIVIGLDSIIVDFRDRPRPHISPLVLVRPFLSMISFCLNLSIVVFLLAQALASTAEFAQDQVGALHPVTDSVAEEVLLLPGLQVSVDPVEVTHGQVVRGVGLTSLRGQSEPPHGLRLVLSHSEPVQ